VSEKHRIALIHATRVAIDPIEETARTLWSEAEVISILEESLSLDRATAKVPMDELNRRIVALCRYAESLAPEGILYTCSAFGKGIEEAARTSPLPVFKPNEAMFERALSEGRDIVMLYTFAPAAEGMEREFEKETEQSGSAARLRSIYVPDALAALREGNVQRHNALIAEAAAKIAGADAILLAHFSMARAAPAVRAATSIPVLTSPESAIVKLKRRIFETPHEQCAPC